MTLRLQDVKTYFICPDHIQKYQERRRHMETLLTNLGFTRFQHYKSGTDKYPKCLVDAICDILSQSMDEPVLILEDDVESTGHLNYELPEGCDAIFFGLSRCAGSKTINQWSGDSKFAPFSETQVRVLNMLSMHALLFVSRQLKEAYISLLRQHDGTGYFNDVLFSRMQEEYLVLANRMPAFWQSNRFNAPYELERVTKVQFPSVVSSTALVHIPQSSILVRGDGSRL